MAGDWIPIRNNLHEDPAVLAITEGCSGLVDVDHTCGKLRRLWVWASEQSADGRIRGGKEEWIDTLLGIENVSEMLKSVGWLRVTADGLVFPNWNRWLSKSAKRRALTAKRVAMHRERKCNAVKRTKMLPQDRTGQESKKENTGTGAGGGFEGANRPDQAGPEQWIQRVSVIVAEECKISGAEYNEQRGAIRANFKRIVSHPQRDDLAAQLIALAVEKRRTAGVTKPWALWQSAVNKLLKSKGV